MYLGLLCVKQIGSWQFHGITSTADSHKNIITSDSTFDLFMKMLTFMSLPFRYVVHLHSPVENAALACVARFPAAAFDWIFKKYIYVYRLQPKNACVLLSAKLLEILAPLCESSRPEDSKNVVVFGCGIF